MRLLSLALLFLSVFLTSCLTNRSLPVSEYVIQRQAYSLCYDQQHRQPRWVYEHLTENNLRGDADRDGLEFKEDPLIPLLFRATNKDYEDFGFDRGHLCPSADARFSQSSMDETFFLSNISPQLHAFNCGYWLKIERYVRGLVKQFKELDVYSGCLYLPKEEKDGKSYVKYQVIGKNSIAVPTHFFKVIFIEKEGVEEAYIIPNSEIALDRPLEEFRSTVEAVERAAGIMFKEKR